LSRKVSIKKASELLGVHILTLKKWDQLGILKPSYRTGGNHRRYDYDELMAFANSSLSKLKETDNKEKVFIYSRVSTRKQADAGNLERQTERLVKYCEDNNYEVIDIFSDVASGLNENRRKLNQMLNRLEEVSKIVIEYQDRLARFGYKYIELHCKSKYVTIEVIENNETQSSHEELTKDLISIITCFSARLYGSRGGKKVSNKFKEDIKTLKIDD
jgi:predicted site-specific integrase-resolvase